MDTSVLVAYYCPEPLSSETQRFLRNQREPALSDLVEVEMVSAIARKIREGGMSRLDGRKVATTFLAHLDGGYYARIPLERTHYHLAREWIGHFEFPLRTLDALHVAIAHLGGLPLATTDEALARSATALGIRVQRIGRGRKT